MKNSTRLKSIIDSAREEAIQAITTIAEKHGLKGLVDLEDIGLNLPTANEEEFDAPYLAYVSKNRTIIDTDENVSGLDGFQTEFILELLKTLEQKFEIGKILYPDIEPSYELVEKYAEIHSLRHDNQADHQEAYYDLKGLMQTGEVTAEQIEKEHSEME